MSTDTQVIDGIIRLAQRQGYFVPDNEPEAGFWFTMKPVEVAAHLDLPQAQQGFYIDIVRKPDEKLELPIAAELKINVSNSHLNYADMVWHRAIADRCVFCLSSRGWTSSFWQGAQ